MDIEDKSPQSSSDEDEASKLKMKPPQAKLFKHSHRQHKKHLSANHREYIGPSSRSSSSHYCKLSHPSHRYTAESHFPKERFETKIVKPTSRHHKDHEPAQASTFVPPAAVATSWRRHIKDRYDEKKTMKSSRQSGKEPNPLPPKRSRRHAVLEELQPSSLRLRAPCESYKTVLKSGSCSAGHVREYEPDIVQEQQRRRCDDRKYRKNSSLRSHHLRRIEKQRVEHTRIPDNKNLQLEMMDDVEKNNEGAVKGVANEEEEEGLASSNCSGSSSSSSSQDNGDGSRSSVEKGEHVDEDGENEKRKVARIGNLVGDEEDDDDANDYVGQEAEEEESADIGMGVNKEMSLRVDATGKDIVDEFEPDKDTLPSYFPAIEGCRSVEEFQCLNRIDEGTFGIVYRAREKRTEKIVALKRLKMEKEKEGFPIASLREINALLKAQHPNVVTVKEIVVGNSIDKIFIVMDYVEHDLKSLMETMQRKKSAFTTAEVKCLMIQLLQAVGHLHDNWILHRDLKTSNLLFSHSGVLKVGDFGSAREYGSPLKNYTPVVVTLWYRAPELLLGANQYSTSIDMWSVGCVFAEFLRMEPLFPGKTEMDQINLIFKALGTPTETDWPDYPKFPVVQKTPFPRHPAHGIRSAFKYLSDKGYDLLKLLLTYDTKKRISAEVALRHEYFNESPVAVESALFSTWPARSDLQAIASNPKPPSGGQNYKELEEDEGFFIGVGERNPRNYNPLQTSFKLKF